VLIFKYLEDKDAFITFYGRMLAKRLLQGTCVSEQAERDMLSKINEVYNHVGKLKQMLLDMDMVKDLDNRFEQWRFTRGATPQDLTIKYYSDQGTAFERSFKVLSQANWPLKPLNTPFVAPIAIAQAHDEFNQFYRCEHPNRKLHWHWHLCHGEMRMYLKSGPSQGYTLHASAYQIAILLLFNKKNQLSYEEIEEGTGLVAEDLNPLLGFFLKTKLLKFEGRDSSKLYTVNDGFASKKVKLDIRVSLKKQESVATEKLHRKIREERKLLIQVSTRFGMVKNLLLSNSGE
jgi:cullin 1